MTDRELMQQALDALKEINKLSIGENAICLPAEIDGAMDALRERLAQREGLTPEERKRRCGELLVQAQYMDSKEYLRWMNDSTKRPWVGLTEDELWDLWNSYTEEPFPEWFVDFKKAYEVIEAKLKEKNT